MAMQFTVTGKQIDVGNSLRQHIEQNVASNVGKYFGSGIVGHAVVSREAHLYCCDLSVRIGRGILIQASEKEVDPYLAADRAVDRIAKRMRRHKRRLRDHHQNGSDRKAPAEFEAHYAIIAAAPEEPDEPEEGIDPDEGRPAIVAEMTTPIETLTVGEAVMRLDLSDRPALMFRNSGHGELNVVYRRQDGNIGWIDPGKPVPAGVPA